MKPIAWIVAAASLAWAGWEVKHILGTRNQLKAYEEFRKAYVDASEGDAICRPDRQVWNSSGKGAFVIAVSGGCPACEVIKPLEDRIDDYGRARGVPIFYIVDVASKNDGLANELKGAGKTVIRVESLKFGVNKVPTFMRIDDSGRIVSMWVGSAPLVSG